MFIRLFGAYFWIEKKMENNLGRRKKDTPKNLFVKHVTIHGSTEDWGEKIKIHSSDC